MSGVDLNDDRGPSINRSISAIIILSSIALAGRLTARRLKKVSLGPSDYILAVGWLIALALAAMSFAGKLLFTNKLIVQYWLGRMADKVKLSPLG